MRAPRIHREVGVTPFQWIVDDRLYGTIRIEGATRILMDDLEGLSDADELSREQGFTPHYRHRDQTEGAFEPIRMETTNRGYTGTIPADYVESEWDILVYFSTPDETGDPLLIPGIYHAENSEPYYVIETR